MKKKVLIMILSALCAFPVFSNTAMAVENLYGSNPENCIIFNEDCDNFAKTRTPNMDNLTAWADKYAATNVGTVMLNTQAYRANYTSSVVESYWEGKDISASGDSVVSDTLVNNIYSASMKSFDWNRARIDLLRERGISPWITIRMNDIHDREMEIPDTTFKREHTEVIMGSKSKNEFVACMDYTYPEVRNYYYAIVRENIERYDADGYELDWMRECYEIMDPALREKTRLVLNQLTRDIRKLLDVMEIERGHEIKLAVRVPAKISAAQNFALDAKTWSEEHLVDLVTVSPRWHSLDTDMEIENWIKLLKEDANNPNIQVGACLEVLYRSNPSYTAGYDGLETGRGAAYSYLSRGADYIYLFNHFDYLLNVNTPDWFTMMRQINSLDNMQGTVRRQAVTFHDRWASDETPVYALPAISSSANTPSFKVHMGNISDIKSSENYYAVIGVDQTKAPLDSALDCSITVNGVVCTYIGATTMPAPVPAQSGTTYDLIKYSIPASAMQDGYNTITVKSADGTTRTVTWVEIYTEPKS